MKLTSANKISKRISCRYGIVTPPEVTVLPYSRTGKKVALGYYNHDDNKIEINKYVLMWWGMNDITEILQHEAVHALCYQEYGHGGHDKDFRKLCKRVGLTGDAMLAISVKCEAD